MNRIFVILSLMACNQKTWSQFIPNNSFENWTSPNGYSDPSEWVTSNNASFLFGADYTATQELPGTDGDYYLKLTVQLAESTGEILPARAFVGNYTFPSAIVFDGFAVNQISSNLSGEYRTFITPNDNASIACVFSKWNDVTNQRDTIGTGIFNITSNVSDWTQFDIPLDILSPEIPDSCRILLSAGGSNAALGTTLEIDNLQFAGEVSAGMQTTTKPIAMFPNPFQEAFTLDLRTMQQSSVVQIYDTQGRIIDQFRQNNTAQLIQLNHLASGLYTVHIYNGEKRWSQLITKQ
jgi:hypothetical protein